MSLCPNYCECGSCKHHLKLCEDCPRCYEERQRKVDQIEHQASVERQRNRLIIPSWKRRFKENDN